MSERPLNRPTNAVPLLFALGVVAGLGYLALAVVATLSESLPFLLTRESALVYDALSVAHVALLGAAAWRQHGAGRRGASTWLYTAGFLHTLVALGVTITIAAAGAEQGFSHGIDLAATLAPMGAAIVPHFVGVSIGQMLDSRAPESSTREASFLEKLTQDAASARQSMEAIYKEREQAIRNETAAMNAQAEAWNSMVTATNELVTALKKDLSDVQGALNQLARATQNSTSKASTSLDTIERSFATAAHNTSTTAARFNDLAANAAETAKSFKEATAVVQDIQKLHVSVVDLLSQDLFKA